MDALSGFGDMEQEEGFIGKASSCPISPKPLIASIKSVII